MNPSRFGKFPMDELSVVAELATVLIKARVATPIAAGRVEGDGGPGILRAGDAKGRHNCPAEAPAVSRGHSDAADGALGDS